MVTRLDTLMDGWARSPSPRSLPSRQRTRVGRFEAHRANFQLKDETPMLRTITRVALTALLVAAGAGGLQAQTTTGGLTGVIRDSDGAVVPGATVTATATATGTALTAIFARVLSRNRKLHIINEQIARAPQLQDQQVTQFVIHDGWMGIALGPKAPGREAAMHPRPELQRE